MNLQVITNTEIVMVTVTIVTLQEQLDLKLQQRQARETGICQVRCEKMFCCFVTYTAAKILCHGQDNILDVFQVRRELYAQCFDELIRQSTINCTERGLLLLRVRDELRMTLHAYQVATWRRHT